MRATPTRLLALLVLCLASCGRSNPSSSSSSGAARGEPDAVYTVRGRVEQIPDPATPLAEFVVKHEPIDTFRNPDGSVGMATMSMPFPLARGVLLDGIAVGDAVEIELAVWTKPGSRGYEARRVTKLPPETALQFGPAHRPPPAPN